MYFYFISFLSFPLPLINQILGQLHDMEHSFVFLITEAAAVYYGVCIVKSEPIEVQNEKKKHLYIYIASSQTNLNCCTANIQFFQHARISDRV